jgi:hypothetical protein
MSFTTHIATFELTNYESQDALKKTISRTMARWNYIEDINIVSWTQTTLHTPHFKFVIHAEQHYGVELYVYANDIIIRDSSRGNVYNLFMNCLRVQLLNPHNEIEDEYDCFNHYDYFDCEREQGEIVSVLPIINQQRNPLRSVVVPNHLEPILKQ